MVLSQIHSGTSASRRWTDAQMVGYTLRFHFLRNLVLRPSLVLAGRNEKALVEDVHQVEFGALQLDPLAFQLIAQVLLLFLNVFGTVGHFLKHDLHHVHLADGEASHFRKRLLLHVLVPRRLQLRKLLLNFRKALLFLLFASDYLSDVSWVEGEHGVRLEVELVRRVDHPIIRRLWSV